MNALIVYGSQYGTTKRYAEQLSEMINLPVISYEDIKELTEYDLIVHFGGLYAGGVKGLKRIIKVLGENTQLIIVTVGLADVYDKENTDNIRKSIRKQVPERILRNTNIFHLRGGIDYDKLNFKHRTMMNLLYHKVKKIPKEKMTAETKAMIETYGTKVDFVDYQSLNQIMEAITMQQFIAQSTIFPKVKNR